MTPHRHAAIAKRTYTGVSKLQAATNSIHIPLAGVVEIIGHGK
jgi:hypothetical protein